MDFLRGLTTPAHLVGAARGIVEAGIIAALGEALVLLPQVDWGEYLFLTPFLYAALRTLEGVADGIDHAKRRSPTG